MTYELLIQHGKTLYYPPVVDGVTIEWERQGQPGKLSFSVVKTENLSFEEGDHLADNETQCTSCGAKIQN